MFDPAAAPAGMSDGGAEPAATGRAREKAPTRAELGSALRGGGGGGGFKDIPGTSAVSPGCSEERAPESQSPSGAGEADYCRRILVRGTGGLPAPRPPALRFPHRSTSRPRSPPPAGPPLLAPGPAAAGWGTPPSPPPAPAPLPAPPRPLPGCLLRPPGPAAASPGPAPCGGARARAASPLRRAAPGSAAGLSRARPPRFAAGGPGSAAAEPRPPRAGRAPRAAGEGREHRLRF